MIFGYVGTPGSGKTYEAVKVILENLKKGKVIFTNIEGLDDRKCREMIKNVCGLGDYAIERQLKIFEPDQLDNFWNHVSPGSIIVLDEVQKIFGSREWQTEKNKQFGYWASTHRHHGFEVILITQNPERIDSAVRALFEWTYHFRKVNFFGSMVQKKYLAYSYAGDDTSGPPLVKRVETYNPLVFRCYKSYVNESVKETDIRKHVNVLKHPVFYAIPIVFGLTLYMIFGKSSFATGDLFGTKKVLEKYENQSQHSSKPSADGGDLSNYSPSIAQVTQSNGVVKFTNRFNKTPNTSNKNSTNKTLDTTSKG